MYVTTRSRSSTNGSQTHFTDRKAIRFRVFRVLFRGSKTRNRGQSPRDGRRVPGLINAQTQRPTGAWLIPSPLGLVDLMRLEFL